MYPQGVHLLLFGYQRFHYILLYFVDRLHKGINVQVGVNTFGERHCTGVSDDLLDHGLIYMRFCQHGDTGVSCIMGLVVKADLLHEGCKIAVVIISVIKVLLIRGMEKVFALGTFEPCSVEREHFVCYGNFSQAVLRLAGDHIEVLLIQVDIFLLEIEEFGDSASVIDQHQYDLIIRIFCKLPESLDLCFGEFIPAAFIWVPVFELGDVHKLRIILVADVIFHGVIIQQAKQAFQFLQGRIILAAGIHHKLEVCQLHFLEHLIVECSAYLIRCFIAFNIGIRYCREFFLRPAFIDLLKG